MKKSLVLVLSLLLVLALAIGCASQKPAEPAPNDQQPAENTDTSWEDIKAKGYFIVGLDDSFPPMGFRDDKGEIVGFDIDMAKKAAEKLGVEVKFQPCVWSGIIMELNNKNIDVVWNGMTITAERQEQINFSRPYLNNRQIIIVKKDSPIKTKADLAGKKVAVQGGSSAVDAVKADEATFKTIGELVEFSNYTEALMDVKVGRMDAVVIDEVVGKYYLTKEPGLYTVLEEDFGSEQYGIGFRKTDEAFRAELQKAIDDMIADGTAKEVSEKWFGEDIILR
ncbi:MAG TPA: amino acid ABC transporter substrate-binding protein [Peptococcaceae bacterium]|nr:amino acid ABC transporter substrate-binding protein [Peptococcaceae bacterium]